MIRLDNSCMHNFFLYSLDTIVFALCFLLSTPSFFVVLPFVVSRRVCTCVCALARCFQSFALHVFAKRPIEPITALGDFRRAIMKRIALAALQIRLSVNSRNDPPYLSVEFNQLDSPREVGGRLVRCRRRVCWCVCCWWRWWRCSWCYHMSR